MSKRKMTNEERRNLSSGLNIINPRKIKETMPLFIKDIESKLNGGKIIYLTETGSVLHGTNSDNSDSDYKGIYIPSLDEVILDNYFPVINIKTNTEDTKNGANDIDMEIYSLFTFFEKASSMESNNIEILFSMFAHKIVFETKESHMIRDNKDLFLSSNVEQFIGFAMSMAYRYSEKGDRLREVDELVNFFDTIMKNMSKAKIKTTPIKDIEGLENFVKDKEYLHVVEKEGANNVMATYLQVLDAFYIFGGKLGHTYKGVKSRLNNFGKRAEKAKASEGLDTKAFAHALRAILQSKELLTTGKIKFPLDYASRLKEMKYSKTMTKLELSNIIEEEYQDLLEMIASGENVILPKSIDFSKLNAIKVDIYKTFLKG